MNVQEILSNNKKLSWININKSLAFKKKNIFLFWIFLFGRSIFSIQLNNLIQDQKWKRLFQNTFYIRSEIVVILALKLLAQLHIFILLTENNGYFFSIFKAFWFIKSSQRLWGLRLNFLLHHMISFNFLFLLDIPILLWNNVSKIKLSLTSFNEFFM